MELDPLHAAGLLILACCPGKLEHWIISEYELEYKIELFVGGVTSNIFTYLCDGDLSLRYE